MITQSHFSFLFFNLNGTLKVQSGAKKSHETTGDMLSMQRQVPLRHSVYAAVPILHSSTESILEFETWSLKFTLKSSTSDNKIAAHLRCQRSKSLI